MGKSIKFIGDRFLNSLVWEDDQTTKDWAEESIFLNADVTAYPGQLSLDNTPHIVEILDDWDDEYIEQHNFLASTQVGKTTILFIIIAKALDTDPCMMQLTIPNDKGVGDYVKTKLDPFLRGIKRLKAKIFEHQSIEKLRTKASTKEVSGGMLFILGNTDANRRSKTVKYKFIDEAALFGSGHIEELIGRTKSFEKAFRKIFIVSSPKHPRDEMIMAYESSYCKKEWQLECPGCKKYFYPTSKHFKFMTKEQYKAKYEVEEVVLNEYKRIAENTAHLKCECGYEIDSREKDTLIKERRCKFVIVEGTQKDKSVGYKINALGTYITNFHTIAKLLIEAEEDDDKLETVYQDYFAEIHKKDYVEIEEDDMLLIGNGLKEWVVPEDTVRIYVTVDNQVDYFFVQVTAICYGMIPHIVNFERVEEWTDVEKIWEICQYLEDENGEIHMASKMMIDRRGYNENGISRTDEADAFVDYMTQKYGEDRIYGGMGMPDITGSKSFSVINHKDYSDQRNELKVKIVKFSNLYLKNMLFRSIDRSIMKAKAETPEDDGYNYDSKLFYINQDIIEADRKQTTHLSVTKMLTAEVFDYAKNPKTGKIAKEKSWIPIRKRNDAIDTSTMALTLAEMDKIPLLAKPTKQDLSGVLSGLI